MSEKEKTYVVLLSSESDTQTIRRLEEEAAGDVGEFKRLYHDRFLVGAIILTEQQKAEAEEQGLSLGIIELFEQDSKKDLD
jgi:hypothetical protein